jgi:hypothetical protein
MTKEFRAYAFQAAELLIAVVQLAWTMTHTS